MQFPQVQLERNLGSKEKEECPPRAAYLQVVSDIDDTLMCSGGHFPAGSDLRYPRNCVYPGVLAFYRGLDTAFASRIQVATFTL